MQTNLPDFVPMAKYVRPQIDSFKPLSYNPDRRSLTLANMRADLHENQLRMANWTLLMGQRRTKNFVLPLAAGILLNEKQRQQFHAEVASHFGLLLPIGGADVDPKLYGEIVDGAKGFNGTLDFYEKELISHYVKAEKGFVYATCRGAQLTAVSLGYRMIQHIPMEVTMAEAHQSVSHDLKIYSTPNDYTKNLWAGLEKMFVYSNHHQAVEYKSGGPLDLAAISHDGVAEVMEFKNGRGILVQSHLELTLGGIQPYGDMSAAKKFFDWVVPHAQAKTRWTCQKLFL